MLQPKRIVSFLASQLCFWLLSAVIGQAQVTDSNDTSRIVWAHCCKGGYTRDKALQLARNIADSRDADVKMILVSSTDSGFRGTAPGVSFEVSLRLMMGGKRTERLAFLFQSPSGLAVDFWDGPDGTFERRVLKGQNPFQLTPSIQFGSYRRVGNSVVVACISSSWKSTAEDTELGRVLRRLFPQGEIEIVLGNGPFFDILLDPLMLPLHGWSWVPSESAEVHTRRWTLK